jgi:protein-tyrosine phosphatase
MSLIYQPPIPTNGPISSATDHPVTPLSPQQQGQRQQRPQPRPGLYVGGQTDAKDLSKLLARNITHIINVTPPKETCYRTGVPNYFEPRRTHTTATTTWNDTSTSTTSLQYLRIPIYDNSTSVTELHAALDAIVSFIDQALLYRRTSILIHCQQGRSRSVTVALMYLIRYVVHAYTKTVYLHFSIYIY